MADLSLQDISQFYNKSVCLYEGAPVYVSAVGERLVSIISLRDGGARSVKFNFEKFKGIHGRLGMVNCYDGAVFTCRIPIRRFSMGLTRENFKVYTLDSDYYPGGREETVNRVYQRNITELGDCISGVYPTFQEAVERSKEMNGSCAFDRQFAITAGRSVYYRKHCVGSLKKGAADLDRIEFSPRWAYLKLLLKGEYEKGCGDFRFTKG